jgi:threonine/homoserine efflux transporter RhtA
MLGLVMALASGVVWTLYMFFVDRARTALAS